MTSTPPSSSTRTRASAPSPAARASRRAWPSSRSYARASPSTWRPAARGGCPPSRRWPATSPATPACCAPRAWCHETCYAVTKDGNEDRFFEAWERGAAFLQDLGVYSGEGGVMGLAAACAGWTTDYDRRWPASPPGSSTKAAAPRESETSAPPGDPTFVLCIENNAICAQALLLCESIRRFGGRHRDAPILAVAPRPGLGIDGAGPPASGRRWASSTPRSPSIVVCPEYGSANRVFAAAWAERRARTDVDRRARQRHRLPGRARAARRRPTSRCGRWT